MKKRIIAEAALAAGAIIGQSNLEAQQPKQARQVETVSQDSQIPALIKKIDEVESTLRQTRPTGEEMLKLADSRRDAFIQILDAVQKTYGKEIDNQGNLSGDQASALREKLKKLGLTSEWVRKGRTALSGRPVTPESTRQTLTLARLDSLLLEAPLSFERKDPFLKKE